MRTLTMVLILASGLAGVCSAQANQDAALCAKASDPDAAIRHCSSAIQSGTLSEENLAITLNNRGNAYESKGEYEHALQDYGEAIRLKPDYAAAYNNRGVTWRKKGDYDRAIQDYGEAIRLKADYALAFNNRGLAYKSKGDYDRAAEDFSQAIRLKPDYTEAFRNRAIAYCEKGDYSHAIQDYDMAIRLEPSAAAMRGRGINRFYLAQFAAASEDLSLALQSNPNDLYAVLWHYLARRRAGLEVKVDLKQNEALKLDDWPGPLVALFLGKLAPAAVLSAAKGTNPTEDNNRRCEAYFFLGQRALLRYNLAEAQRLFREALKTGATGNFAYIGAGVELKRLAAPRDSKSSN